MVKFSHSTLAVLMIITYSTNWTNAQPTNAVFPFPATKLEAFDTNTSVIILKASADIGSISAEAGDVAVRSREITDTSTGHKEQGLGIDITLRGQPRDALLIDYDEIPSLINAIDYMTRLDVSVTPLTAFDAAYTTKGGFRIAALGTRRTGAVQFGVRNARSGAAPVVFSRDEMSRLVGLINQAKATLDAVRR